MLPAGSTPAPCTFYAGVAQEVEHLICNQEAAGSNPAAGSNGQRFARSHSLLTYIGTRQRPALRTAGRVPHSEPCNDY